MLGGACLLGSLVLIQIYAPTEDADILDKEQFYAELEHEVIKAQNKNREIIITGDFNARTGNDFHRSHGVMGKHGGEVTINTNGQRLSDFCLDFNLLIENSLFPHKKVDKITFSAQERNDNSLDYFLYSRNIRRLFSDVKVIRGAEIGSDHMMLIADTQIPKPWKRPRRIYIRIDISQLQNPQFQERYVVELREINHDERLDELWKNIKDRILQPGTTVCGIKRYSSMGKRSEWWSERVKAAVQRKKIAWKGYLNSKK